MRKKTAGMENLMAALYARPRVPSVAPVQVSVAPPSNPYAPYNPLPPGTPGTGSNNNSGVVPPGGRDFSEP